MAGILDKKTRFIDLVVTQEGKRQLASGKLRAEYASVTDRHTFYDPSEKDDISNRIYFQVMERPENVIVMEKDDSGKLIDFNFSPTTSIVGNDIFDKDPKATKHLKLTAVTGSAFASTSEKLMRSFLEHFKNIGQPVLNVDSGKLQSLKCSEKNIPCINKFFNEKLADEILLEKGPASIIHGSGIFFHLEELQN